MAYSNSNQGSLQNECCRDHITDVLHHLPALVLVILDIAALAMHATPRPASRWAQAGKCACRQEIREDMHSNTSSKINTASTLSAFVLTIHVSIILSTLDLSRLRCQRSSAVPQSTVHVSQPNNCVHRDPHSFGARPRPRDASHINNRTRQTRMSPHPYPATTIFRLPVATRHSFNSFLADQFKYSFFRPPSTPTTRTSLTMTPACRYG